MKIPILKVLLLLTLLTSANAQQGGFFARLVTSIGQAVVSLGGVISSGLTAISGSGDGIVASFASFVAETIDTVALAVAGAVIGEDPSELACESLQAELSKLNGVDCGCEADIDIVTTTANVEGTCSIQRGCPVRGICGICQASYTGTGDIELSAETVDGSALITGSCDLTEIDFSTAATVFDFTATVSFDGSFSALPIDISSCDADFKDSTGAVVATCDCSADACGPQEVEINCSGDFTLPYRGCVSIVG